MSGRQTGKRERSPTSPDDWQEAEEWQVAHAKEPSEENMDFEEADAFGAGVDSADNSSRRPTSQSVDLTSAGASQSTSRRRWLGGACGIGWGASRREVHGLASWAPAAIVCGVNTRPKGIGLFKVHVLLAGLLCMRDLPLFCLLPVVRRGWRLLMLARLAAGHVEWSSLHGMNLMRSTNLNVLATGVQE